jgi:hypothetical protein
MIASLPFFRIFYFLQWLLALLQPDSVSNEHIFEFVQVLSSMLETSLLMRDTSLSTPAAIAQSSRKESGCPIGHLGFSSPKPPWRPPNFLARPASNRRAGAYVGRCQRLFELLFDATDWHELEKERFAGSIKRCPVRRVQTNL